MRIKEYLKESFRLTSLIFTTLVIINLFLQTEALTHSLAYMLLISAISGLLHFLIEDNEKYSSRRILFHQSLYLLIICLQIALANMLLHWQLGTVGLLLNFMIVFLIYFFIRFIMYSNDRKQADEINQFIQKRKRDKS
ncbi:MULTISPECIES: DUF3021 family protein [unclassified Enterococcus]|uniref:DUF3021 family protein n=1 Tax=unclassified Enterococcus TaxID=2608891 RepID=UPI001CE11FC8|nr:MULTISPECIES: DUF3021 family protein [unclassified Enterococcus]MCA5012093.1 DUF3021 family protein [Enterococcus sp. S23]MCA5015344.1 DUF3021 family protein [Enterococcus sp. S22(2020)]